jgi:gluconolactonase
MRRAGLLLAVACVLGAENAIVPEGARVEKVWGEGEFTEGPACGPDGCVYFSDIGNRMSAEPNKRISLRHRPTP